MNELLFNETCKLILNNAIERDGVIGDSSHIGTLKEKTVHAIVKNYIEPNPSFHEIKTKDFYADIINEKGIIEIQTSNFDKLRKKLNVLLDLQPVTIVYPIAHIKNIYWINEETGEINQPRKSPKKGNPHDIFRELYKIKFYLTHPNLRLHIILMDMDEYRILDGWSKDQKKGATKCDRIPKKLVNEMQINSIEDYKNFMPSGLPNEFTVSDYKRIAKISQRNAGLCLHILNYIGTIKRIGKDGRAYVYTMNTQP